MQKSGWIDKARTQWFSANCDEGTASQLKPVDIPDLAGLYVLVSGLLFLAIIVAAVNLWWRYKRNHAQTSVSKRAIKQALWTTDLEATAGAPLDEAGALYTFSKLQETQRKEFTDILKRALFHQKCQGLGGSKVLDLMLRCDGIP